jgi:hypothetical protein
MNPLQFGFFQRMEPYFKSSIENQLRLLFEAKHLYQNVKVELPDLNVAQKELKEFLGKSIKDYPGSDDPINFFSISPSNIEWTINNPGRRRLPMGTPIENTDVSIEFTPPTVKLFCGNCKRVEAFNFQYGQDLLKEFIGVRGFSEPIKEQVFSFAYQCQSCKSTPEIFVVRRDSLKLIQSGRTPIEEVELPAFLPKDQKKFFSDAVVAFNSGQIPAGKFLLRTFIEQYIRDFTKDKTSLNIDELFEKYGASLPSDFKQRFPSLAKIYSLLSTDIHSADSTIDLFIQTQKDIQEHFEAKKVFKIS